MYYECESCEGMRWTSVEDYDTHVKREHLPRKINEEETNWYDVNKKKFSSNDSAVEWDEERLVNLYLDNASKITIPSYIPPYLRKLIKTSKRKNNLIQHMLADVNTFYLQNKSWSTIEEFFGFMFCLVKFAEDTSNSELYAKVKKTCLEFLVYYREFLSSKGGWEMYAE